MTFFWHHPIQTSYRHNECFTAECELAGIKISTSKSEGHNSCLEESGTRLLCRVVGFTFHYKMRILSDNPQSLVVELLLSWIETSQLMWIGHLRRMPPGQLSLELMKWNYCLRLHMGTVWAVDSGVVFISVDYSGICAWGCNNKTKWN